MNTNNIAAIFVINFTPVTVPDEMASRIFEFSFFLTGDSYMVRGFFRLWTKSIFAKTIEPGTAITEAESK